jgi:hypothetical protein
LIFLQYICRSFEPYSVSSVRTLEEAKVAAGCLYMPIAVQEVGILIYFGARRAYFFFSSAS